MICSSTLLQAARLGEQLEQADALAAMLRAENQQLRSKLQQAQAALAVRALPAPGAPDAGAAVPQLQQGKLGAPAAFAPRGDLAAQAACQAAPPLVGPLPFEGLSQMPMSQGSLEWLEGIIMPTGSSTQAELDAMVAAAAADASAPAQQPERARQPVLEAQATLSMAGNSPAPRTCPSAQPPFLEHAHGACPPRVFELPLSQPAAEPAAARSTPAQDVAPAGMSMHTAGLFWLRVQT